MDRFRQRTGDRGFTLIELLVVMVVIGILAAIAIPVFLGQRQKAAEASVKADIRTLIQHQNTVRLEGSYQIARQLNTNGYAFKTSRRNIISVISVSATDYCIAGSSAGAGPDPTNLGSYIGWDHKMYYATNATGIREATAADPGCIAGFGTTTNGWWNSSGYQNGSIVLPT